MSAGSSQARLGAVEVRPYQDEDEGAVVALLQDSFGGWPTDLEGADPVRFLRWKHRLSPFGESLAVVAVDDGTVVGHLAWLPWVLRCRGERIMTFRTTDFVVARSHRGGGVSAALIQAGRGRLGDEYVLSWSNPNQLSRGRASGSGQSQAGAVRAFVCPSSSRVRAWAGRAAGPPTAGAREAAAVLADAGHWLGGLLDSCRSDRLQTARDLAFLRWRYGAFPDYRAVCLDDVGIAIFRLRDVGRVRVAKVCELLVADGDPHAARRLLRRVARAASAQLLTCSFRSPRAALCCGFWPSPRAQVVMVRPVRRGLLPDPTRRRSWDLSLGDLELI